MMHNDTVRLLIVVLLLFVPAYVIACVVVLPQETEPASRAATSASKDRSDVDHRIDELRSDLLDYRAGNLERWMWAVGMFITFLAAFAAAFGFLGYLQFKASAEEKLREITRFKDAAEADAKTTKNKATEAGEVVDRLKAIDLATGPAVRRRLVDKERETEGNAND